MFFFHENMNSEREILSLGVDTELGEVVNLTFVKGDLEISR